MKLTANYTSSYFNCHMLNFYYSSCPIPVYRALFLGLISRYLRHQYQQSSIITSSFIQKKRDDRPHRAKDSCNIRHKIREIK